MIIEHPREVDIANMRSLWHEAFGDTDEFIDAFFATAFSMQRCRIVKDCGKVIAALYWFDCLLSGSSYAYIYAVSTATAHRGKGVCHMLMEDTHRYLSSLGYIGAILVPGGESLFRFYEKMGYSAFGGICEITVSAGAEGINIKKITGQEYADIRRRLLPLGGVVQEGENIDFLATQSELYCADDVLLCVRREGRRLFAQELLGDADKIPSILFALDCDVGEFRIAGSQKPFAMYLPLCEDCTRPKYFGLAFD